MKADELMIGNYYNEFGIPKQVTAEFMLKLENIQKCKKIAIDVSPIPLTEEWLLKFGFEIKDTVNRGYLIPINYDFQKEYLYCSNDGIIALWSEKKQQDFGIMRGCKYVHQLQNLYFALTNKKLTIK